MGQEPRRRLRRGHRRPLVFFSREASRRLLHEFPEHGWAWPPAVACEGRAVVQELVQRVAGERRDYRDLITIPMTRVPSLRTPVPIM